MSSTLISAVIPTRGRPELCLRAVRSVLAQTYPDVEVIVVIDGPDPSTSQALSQVADSRVRVIELPSRMGGSITRNCGMEASRGGWVAFLDDDDEWVANKLERQYDVIKAADNPTNTIVSTQVYYQRKRTSRVVPRALYDNSASLSEYLFCRSSLSDLPTLQTSTLLLSRDLCLKTSFTPGLPKHQDYDFLLRAKHASGCEIKTIPEPLAVFHQDHSLGHVGGVRNWEFSLNWMESQPELFTPNSRMAFFLTIVAPPATRSRLIAAFILKNRKGVRIRLLWIFLFLREWAKAAVRKVAALGRTKSRA